MNIYFLKNSFVKLKGIWYNIIMKEFIDIGKIVSSRGLDGTVKLISGFSQKDFKNLKTCLIDNVKYEITKISGKSGCLFLKFKEIDNIDKAEALKNKIVFVNRESIVLAAAEYLIDDIIGIEVYTDKGTYLGLVDSIENFGSKDVYTVKNKNLEHTFCLVDGLIESVNFEENKLVLNSEILSGVMV